MTDPTRGALPYNITSYDLLKAFAVITMIIDHIGFYFFPEQTEWRVIGRMSMPVWMFLIGYARTRDIPMILIMGGCVLVLGNFMAGMAIFSLNILFAIALTRLWLDSIMKFALSSVSNMFMLVMLFILMFFPTNYIIEYGTLSIMFAMFGYMVRHQATIKYNNESLLLFMSVVFIVYCLYQKIVMGMDNTEFYTMGAGVALTCLILSQFQAKEFPEWTAKLPKPAVSVLKIMGRRTLEIYVAHLMLFKLIGVMGDSDRFNWFQLHLIM